MQNELQYCIPHMYPLVILFLCHLRAEGCALSFPRLVYLQEWDWTVLEHVLTALPEVLQNKSLILSANPALNTMTAVLCHMVSLHFLRLKLHVKELCHGF